MKLRTSEPKNNKDNTNVTVYEASASIIYTNRQADQQFQLESMYDTLGRSFKVCQDILGRWDQDASLLEKRILKLRRSLWADEVLCFDLDDLQADIRNTEECGMILCDKCQNHVPRRLYSVHLKSCFAKINQIVHASNRHFLIDDRNRQQKSCPSSIDVNAVITGGSLEDNMFQQENISGLNTSTGLITKSAIRIKRLTSVEEAKNMSYLKKCQVTRRHWAKQRAALVSQVETINHISEYSIKKEINVVNNSLELQRKESGQIASSFVHGSRQILESDRFQMDLNSELDNAQQCIYSTQMNIRIGDDMDKKVVNKMIQSFSNLKHHRDAERLRFALGIMCTDKRRTLMKTTLYWWKIEVSTQLKYRSTMQLIVKLIETKMMRRALKMWMGTAILGKRSEVAVMTRSGRTNSVGAVSLDELKQWRSEALSEIHDIVNQLISSSLQNELSSSEIMMMTDTDNIILYPNEHLNRLCVQKGLLYFETGEYFRAASYFRQALGQILAFSDCALNADRSEGVFKFSAVVCYLCMRIVESYVKAEKINSALIFIEQMVCFLETMSMKDIRGYDALKVYISYAIEQASAMSADDLVARASVLLKAHFRETVESENAIKHTITSYDPTTIESLREKLNTLSSNLFHLPHLSGAVIRELPYVKSHHYALMQKQNILNQDRKSMNCSYQGCKTAQMELMNKRLKINDELRVARLKKGGLMKSMFIHEQQEVLIDVRELRDRLNAMVDNVDIKLSELKANEEVLATNIKNLDEELSQIDREIELEQSRLLTRASKKVVRCARIQIGCEFPKSCGTTALSISKEVYVYDLFSNNLKALFFGDHESDHHGEVQGHLSTITCLDINNTYVFSGSLDKNVICWDIAKAKLIYVARGHEGTVTCIRSTSGKDTQLISSSLDKTIIMWDVNGKMLSRIRGHLKGIISLDVASRYNATGDCGGQIFIWTKDVRIRHLSIVLTMINKD
jgi:tetratricopeptide (TPR) repeat protein